MRAVKSQPLTSLNWSEESPTVPKEPVFKKAPTAQVIRWSNAGLWRVIPKFRPGVNAKVGRALSMKVIPVRLVNSSRENVRPLFPLQGALIPKNIQEI